jgi:hypothetical protein
LFFTFFVCSAPAQSATGPLPPLASPHGPLPPTFWEQHGNTVLIAGFAFMAVVAIVLLIALRSKPAVVVPPEVLAREALARLRTQPESGAVLSEISRILRRYVTAVIGLPEEELTTAEFAAALQKSEQIGGDVAQSMIAFLRECDRRKFSPAGAPAPLNAVDRTLAIVAQIENQKASPAAH